MKIVPNVAAGYFYRWKEGLKDFEFVRFGARVNIFF
jgi:hypothetical protein